MNYHIRGKGTVTLTQNDFIAKGGEGSIYGKGNIIYKIYHSKQKMVPPGKINELQTLTESNILNPIDVLLDKNNTPIGFTMNWIKNVEALPKLFSTDFRKRTNIDSKSTVELIENMKKTTQLIHNANCLIVDGNEFNYLVDTYKFVIPYFIDVDSYQTPHFPATAIMMSIRDWHTKDFSELSDWFSFAIIAFQLFVGIHPYKGGHPGYKKNDFEKRMRDNISVLNPKTTTPPSVRDFSCIPSEYFSWFADLFEKGKRYNPPLLPGTISILPIKKITIQSTDNLEITLVREFNNEILYYGVCYGISVTKTEGKPNLFINRTGYHVSHKTEVLFSPKTLTPVLTRIDSSNRIKFMSLNKSQEVKNLDLQCTDKMIINNTLFVINEGNLIEIKLQELNTNISPLVYSTWNIMPLSSKMLSGLIYQDVLGKPYVVIPVPKEDSACSCIIKPIPELEGYRIIDAKHDSGVCIFIGSKGSDYKRFILRFDKTYNTYDCRILDIVDYNEINFVTLDNNVVVSIIEDKVLEIFSRDPKSKTVKEIKDPDINPLMKLCKDGIRTMFFRQNKLYAIRLKNN